MTKTTRKIISAIFIIVCIICLMTGCSTMPTEPAIVEPTNVPTEEPVEIREYDFPQLEVVEENVSEYIKNVINRDEEDFFTDDEEKIYLEKGYHIGDHYVSKLEGDRAYCYYYPVILTDANGYPIIWYTDKYAFIGVEEIEGPYISSLWCAVHYPQELNYSVIKRTENYAVTYDKEKGIVQQWRFGKVLNQYEVPAGAEYCGYSFFEGYIFHLDKDVFALHGIDALNDQGKTVCIAHDVKYVIDADYHLSSDPWSQPLFLMEDGRVLAYVRWSNDGLSDDPEHLYSLEYEGGYDR